MKVTKELYIEAEPHVAVYAQHQTYVGREGTELIEAVRHEARGNVPGLGMRYYAPMIYQRRSLDNGRAWIREGEPWIQTPATLIGSNRQFTPQYYYDQDHAIAVSMFLTYDIRPSQAGRRERFSDEGLEGDTHRMMFCLSRDGGRHWDAPRQIIHNGAGYDAVHWGPGLWFGKNGGGGDLVRMQKMKDGTIIGGMTVNLQDGKRYQCLLVHARWKPDLSGLDWEFSDYIGMTPAQSSQGCCEPMPALLDDGRIFLSLRCCGDRETKKFPSLKYWVISDNNGWTFSKPQPLTYEDGKPVWSPSSFAGIIRSSRNQRYYWIGNILPQPTYSAYPRYPLCIAELIPKQGVLIRSSVTVIDTKPPECREERRRYTNFGFYEERGTGDIILTLPEQPRTDWADFTADCYRYRVAVQ